MVQARNSRPQRRDRGAAGPARTHKAHAAAPASAPAPEASEDGLDPILYPNLAAQQEQDRQEHVRLAREAGLTRKQASRHADEHLHDR